MRTGFSLIELLVVVLIMGILASVTVPQYMATVWKGRFAEVYQITPLLEKEIETYIMKSGFPKSGPWTAITEAEGPISGLKQTNWGGRGFCSKYICYRVECSSQEGGMCQWAAFMFSDAENRTYDNSITEMYGYYMNKDQSWGAKSHEWYRACWYESGHPNSLWASVGYKVCQSTTWQDLTEGF